ncbi:MAG TPA: hypothetical protein VEZ14_05470 [Dehalococcoidia bacterium]|nr:hypothetical protein [Dehalococcoidia bacterium]
MAQSKPSDSTATAGTGRESVLSRSLLSDSVSRVQAVSSVSGAVTVKELRHTDGRSICSANFTYELRSAGDLYATIQSEDAQTKLDFDLLILAPDTPKDVFIRGADPAHPNDWEVLPSGVSHADEYFAYLKHDGPFDLTTLPDTIENVQPLPDDTIDGVTCIHLRGMLNLERAGQESQRTGLPLRPGPTPVIIGPVTEDFWMAKDTHLLRRLVSHESLMQSREVVDATVIADYLSYNAAKIPARPTHPIVIAPSGTRSD